MSLAELVETYICFITYWFFFPPALELLKNAIAKAGYSDKIVIGMDVAASEFYKDGKYDLDFKSPDDPSRYISSDKLADLYRSFVSDYPGEFSKKKKKSVAVFYFTYLFIF